ncbi:unnamed protein product [Gongylonema pulchrum]|uniref:Secreted protein n=1 Tax=Gongylonema pulchrum TaxID=637853 RepID=A0A183ERE9_9BILA|nr:unnamed protein product [Gongylonema pulchrum]
MVPCQYLIGIFMLLLSYRVSEIMGDSNVVYLTLDSPDFANRFFRSEPKSYGLVSLAGEFHL